MSLSSLLRGTTRSARPLNRIVCSSFSTSSGFNPPPALDKVSSSESLPFVDHSLYGSLPATKPMKKTRPTDSQYIEQLNSYDHNMHKLRLKYKSDYDDLVVKKKAAFKEYLVRTHTQQVINRRVKEEQKKERAEILLAQKADREKEKAQIKAVRAETRKKYEAFRMAQKVYQMNYIAHEAKSNHMYYANGAGITPSMFSREPKVYPTGWWPPEEEEEDDIAASHQGYGDATNIDVDRLLANSEKSNEIGGPEDFEDFY